MRVIGNMDLMGGGHVGNFRCENLAQDPASPIVGQIWYNTTTGKYHTFDGTSVRPISTGGDTDALRRVVEDANVSAGFNEDGSLAAWIGRKLLGATSLVRGMEQLDAAIVANEAALESLGTAGEAADLWNQSQDDIIGVAAADGMPGQADSNYLSGSASLLANDARLDAAIHLVAERAGVLESETTSLRDEVLLRAGGQMAGDIDLNNNRIVGLPAIPTSGSEAVSKSYVESLLAGLDFQADVLDVQVDADLDPALTAGARYIITNAAALHANFGTIADVANGDIVQYDGEAFVVSYDVSERGTGAIAWNRAAGSFFFYADGVWAAFGGLNGITAGRGLSKDGNTLNVNVGAGIASVPEGEVGIDVRANSGLFLTVDGLTASTAPEAQLAILADGARGLASTAAGLGIADGGINEGMIAAASFQNGITGGDGELIELHIADTDSRLIADVDGLRLDPDFADSLAYLDGAEFTGPVLLSQDPVEALEAATKQYVDALQSKFDRSFFQYDSEEAATIHQVDHYIGTTFCSVTVIDSSGNVIIPDSINFMNSERLTVTFSSAIMCTVVVIGKGNDFVGT